MSSGVYLGLNSHGVSQRSVTMARNQDGTRLLSSHQHSSSLNTLQSALLIFFTLLPIQPGASPDVMRLCCVLTVMTFSQFQSAFVVVSGRLRERETGGEINQGKIYCYCRVCHWRLSLYLCFVYKRQHAMQPLPTHCILQLICLVNKGISICSPRCLHTSTVRHGTTQGLHNDKFQIGFWRHLLQHFLKVKSVTTPPRPEAFGVFALKSADQSLMLYIWKQSILQCIIENVQVSFWCYDTRGATKGDNRQDDINLFFYLWCVFFFCAFFKLFDINLSVFFFNERIMGYAFDVTTFSSPACSYKTSAKH